MADLLTYGVYVGLLVTMVGLLFLASKVHEWQFKASSDVIKEYSFNFFHFLALLLLTIVVAIRYDVGTDWNTYNSLFNMYKNNPLMTFGSQEMEFGYYYVNKIVIWFGGGAPVVFGLLALIAWYFSLKSVSYYLVPLLVFFLFVDEYFFISLNLVRQFTALGIFICSIKFIEKKQFLKFLLCLSFASLFHLSAIILLPLYFLPYKRLYNQKLWIIVYCITLLLANIPIFIELFLKLFIRVTEFIPLLNVYIRYILNAKFGNFRPEIGLGYIFRVVVSLFLLFASKRVIQAEPKTKVYYVLFFIGLIIYNLFYMIPLIVRINHYFIIFRSFILAFTAWFLWKDKSMMWKYGIMGLVILYLALYLFAIHNGSHGSAPYQWVF